jgi:predicted DNA-binding protein
MAFCCRLNPELDRRLNEEAKRRGLTKAQLLQAILREWIHEQDAHRSALELHHAEPFQLRVVR